MPAVAFMFLSVICIFSFALVVPPVVKFISDINALLPATTSAIFKKSAGDVPPTFTSNFKFQFAPVILTLFIKPILLLFISNVAPSVISNVDEFKLSSFFNISVLLFSIFTALFVIVLSDSTVTSPCTFTFPPATSYPLNVPPVNSTVPVLLIFFSLPLIAIPSAFVFIVPALFIAFSEFIVPSFVIVAFALFINVVALTVPSFSIVPLFVTVVAVIVFSESFVNLPVVCTSTFP